MKKETRIVTDKSLVIIFLITFCLFLVFITYRQKSFRSQVNEIRGLEYSAVALENLDDGFYSGKITLSFMALSLNAEVENHHYKNISIATVTEDHRDSIQAFIDEYKKSNQITVPSKKDRMIDYLVFIKCLDSLIPFEN